MKTRNRIWIYPFLTMGLALIITVSCKKSDQGQLPVIFTKGLLNVWPTSAIFSGEIASNGGSSLSEQGFCCSTVSLPDTTDNKISTVSTNTGEFSLAVTELSPRTNYYVRAYAKNSIGIAYGEELSFTTPADHAGEAGTVADVDRNVYTSVTIGTQLWMVENLKTAKFKDGTDIPIVTDNAAWANLTTPGCCWYNNDASYKTTFGALYNWYTVHDSRNLCPDGWHAPTHDEWTTLMTFLGGGSVAVGKLKEAGILHWISPNTLATNETGFTALPGGKRDFDGGSFSNLTATGSLWASTDSSTTYAYCRQMGYDNFYWESSAPKTQGFSVRCLKDD